MLIVTQEKVDGSDRVQIEKTDVLAAYTTAVIDYGINIPHIPSAGMGSKSVYGPYYFYGTAQEIFVLSSYPRLRVAREEVERVALCAAGEAMCGRG